MRIVTSLSLLVFISLLSLTAKSQVFTPTIAGGMGGAGRSAVDGGESSFMNPASLAHLREYYFGAHFQHGNHPLEGDFNRYAIQIADGTPTNIVPGAFSYYRQNINLPAGGSRTDQDYQISIAGVLHSMFAMGVGAHYLTQSGQGHDDTQINGNVGLIFNPGGSFGIGLVGYDIAPVQSTATPDRRLIPTFGAGLHYVFPDILRVRLDVVRPTIQPFADQRNNVMAGLESFFNPEFAFRLGAQWLEVADEMNMTAGFGFRGPRLSFDYSIQKDLRAAGGFRHLVDLWLPL